MKKSLPEVNYAKPNYYIYYDLADEDDKRRIITNKGDIKTIDKYDPQYKDYGKNYLKFIEGKPNDQMLKDYLVQFKKWCYSAKLNRVYSVDLTQGDIFAMRQVFFSLIQNYKKHEKITATEFKWFEKCANNALMYLREKDIELECTSYDRKMCYANILNSDIKIPTKSGKEYTLKKLPTIDNLKCGFYRVKIKTDDTDFTKCFVYSKDDVYVDISMRFLLENKEKFNLKIALIQDDEPNAYLFDDNDLIVLNSMTNKWFEVAKDLKTKYKNNPYMKQIASATWGVIQQRNKLKYTIDEINEKNMDVGLSDKHKYKIIGRSQIKGVDYVELVNTTCAYKYNLRLKPWVTAKARYDMGTLALKYLGNIVRIQTDSISFDKPIEINDENYAIESKTTGLIHWHNVNNYHNKTNDYKSKNFEYEYDSDEENL